MCIANNRYYYLPYKTRLLRSLPFIANAFSKSNFLSFVLFNLSKLASSNKVSNWFCDNYNPLFIYNNPSL